MTLGHSEPALATTSEQLLTQGADAERGLLRQEQKAERRLRESLAVVAKDEERLRKAQARLKRSQASAATAVAALQECQTRRAAGPVPRTD